MKRAYKLEGVDCADCAKKLENKLNTIDHVNKVTFNFLTEKCVFDAEEEFMDTVIEKAKEIISRLEPDANFYR